MTKYICVLIFWAVFILVIIFYNIHFSPLFLDIGLFESLPFLFSIYFLKYSHQNITYLGVPLISGRLSYSDCNPLIDRLTERMRAWTAKHLSFAG